MKNSSMNFNSKYNTSQCTSDLLYIPNSNLYKIVNIQNDGTRHDNGQAYMYVYVYLKVKGSGVA